MSSMQLQDITRHFQALTKQVPLRPIRSAADYKRAVTALNELLDSGANNEKHPLADLVATLGELIADYDVTHYLPEDASTIAVLQFLMQQHDLKQSDLPEIGSQGVVSEILSGKRELNTRQIQALSRRFGVSAAAFL
jgi:HTH-type transcriptional regulator / antitoxin HigA